MLFEIVFGQRGAESGEVIGRRAKDQSLTAEIAMAYARGPSIGPANAHHDVDLLVHRIDESVRKRNMRHQPRVLPDEIQNQRQDMQPSVSGRQIDPQSALGLVLLGMERLFNLFEISQRVNTRVPSRLSSLAMLLLTAELLRLRRSAAAVKLPKSATMTNTSMPLRRSEENIRRPVH
jgi:hypothetical protein